MNTTKQQKQLAQRVTEELTCGDSIPRNFSFENNGTTWSIVPETKKALKWMEDNLATESWQWLGNTLVVDHRMAQGVREFIYENFN